MFAIISSLITVIELIAKLKLLLKTPTTRMWSEILIKVFPVRRFVPGVVLFLKV